MPDTTITRFLAEISVRPTTIYAPFEMTWQVYGPIPSATMQYRPLPTLEGRLEWPDTIVVDEVELSSQAVLSIDGLLDFKSLFGHDSGHRFAFATVVIVRDTDCLLGLSFGADWTSFWWLNGDLVYDRRDGNEASASDLYANQITLPLKAGRNTLTVRVGAGSTGWNVRMLSYTDQNRLQQKSSIKRSATLKPAATSIATRDYTATGLRLENRCKTGTPPRTDWADEAQYRAQGVEARWIEIVDNLDDPITKYSGSPFYPNPFLPPLPASAPGEENSLPEYIDTIQALGLPVISWFPMSCSGEALLAHPDWRSVPFPGVIGETYPLGCINSPYGDALIGFVLDAADRLGIDGFFFDWSLYSGRVLGCACRFCRAKFTEQEGLPFPETQDWDDIAFKRWLLWRPRTFVEFWGRLSGRVKRERPAMTLCINHQYRGPDGWKYAGPMDRTDVEIVGAMESSSLSSSSTFISRLARAYGYQDTENWMGLHALTSALGGDASVFAYHALSCMTTGSLPSFGGELPPNETEAAFHLLGSLINPRRAWVGGTPVPDVALHVSERADLLVNSRPNQAGRSQQYWHALQGWENLLTETQHLTDIIFDGHLSPQGLARYKIVVMPGSVALSNRQVLNIKEYVHQGGILLTRPDFGAYNEWGQISAPERLRDLLGEDITTPHTQPWDGAGVQMRQVGQGTVVALDGDVGGRFRSEGNRGLAQEIAALLAGLTSSPITTTGGPNVQVGLFRHAGYLILHVANVPAFSQISQHFPNPLCRAPQPIHDLMIQVRGFPVRHVRSALNDMALDYDVQGDTLNLRLPLLEWGDIFRLDF